ncbi:MAG: 2-C-methyl-D-erythritol 4-phosphate cytidylyltransferase [Tidjanibacter sp.]|nr:2-C-methyl-D-erythritol 4-phosphate cytidylyltransferase [Tidjanibacter sp.]
MDATTKLGVIIVAGGVGNRMGADVPKQFLSLGGKSILEITLRRFLDKASEIVVVLPSDQHERWAEICEKSGLCGTHKVCSGGATRFESVKCGLAALGECDLVAVHDGVRPLVSEEMIGRGVAVAAETGTAIPIVEAVDSFRVLTDAGFQVIDRSRLRAVQTPQIFRSELLREAYKAEPSPRFTDDATVVEEVCGVELCYYDGERKNLKITTQDDLLIAESFIQEE